MFIAYNELILLVNFTHHGFKHIVKLHVTDITNYVYNKAKNACP